MLSVRPSPGLRTSRWLAASVFAILPALGTPVQADTASSSVVSLDGNDWLLGQDPKNVGRAEQWFRSPRPEAKKANVPFVIQGTFPGYYGVAWYWRQFAAPVNQQPEGRYLLRFWAVRYKADVWLNDVLVGSQEGGEDPFLFDVTKAVKPGQANRLAVRVLNPTSEPIDGIKLGEFPNRGRNVPFKAGASWNIGGIVDSVELLLTPAVRVDDVFPRPSDFFRASLARGADERTRFINAVRANPKVIGYSITGLVEGSTGEGLWTNFREFKPGTADALFEGLAPLRWCNFVEPVNVYRNTPVRLEAVLANEDAMLPGKCPVHLLVVGPKANRAFEKRIELTIPEKTATFEPPIVMPAFDATVVIDGPPGKYRFLVEFERGGAATGGDTEFYVADPAELPAVDAEIVVWGEDPQVVQWLSKSAIKHRSFDAKAMPARGAILALSPPKENTARALIALAHHLARGSTVIFLSPGTLARDKAPTGWLPLTKKGGCGVRDNWVCHKDEWCKAHPIFEGLPSRCLMDYTFYRELIPDNAFYCEEAPQVVVAGAAQASLWYGSGVLVGVYRFNEGRFLINSLLVRENLGTHPAADRLLRNMLRWASADAARTPAPLPSDFEKQLKAIGYLDP